MQPSLAKTKVRWSHTSLPKRRAQPALGEGHADRVGEPLPERAGRHLDARRVVVLGVAGRPAAPLAELAQVLERQVVAGEVEHGVLQDAGVPAGEDEAVAVGPLRVARVVAHDARPEHVGQRGQRHGGARVPGVGRFGRVHGEAADDVDAQLDQPRVLHHRRGVSAPSRGHPNRPLPPVVRAVTYSSPLMASRMQVPPNSDLTLGMTCVDKATPGRCTLAHEGRRALRQPGRDHAGGLPRRLRRLGHGGGRRHLRRRTPGVLLQRRDEDQLPRRRARPGRELICTAEVVSGGRRVAFVEASITARAPGEDAERLVARASSTYMFKDRD